MMDRTYGPTLVVALALMAVPVVAAVGSAVTPSPGLQPYLGTTEEKLLPGEDQAPHRYGHAMDADGDTAAISVAMNTDAGAVDVWVDGEDGWTKETTLRPPSSVLDDDPELGSDVAVDGDTLVAGAAGIDTDERFESGGAVVYERTGSSWAIAQTITSPDAQALDRFGGAVAVEGDTLAIAEPEDEIDGEFSSNGAVHIYEKVEGTYQHTAELTPPADDDRERLGVAMELDEGTLAVGAPEDETPNGDGAVYLYEETESGWAQIARLTAPEADGAEQFGQALDLDGDRLIVGAPGPQVGICCPTPPSPPGQAHVFVNGDDGWTHEARLTPVTNGDGASLGMGVALQADRAFAGSPDQVRDTVHGVVNVFERTADGWQEAGRAISEDPASGDAFGSEIVADSGHLLVAEPGDDEISHQAGAVHAVGNLAPSLVTPQAD